MTIHPHYHQVCSSDLVSSQWIQYNTPSLDALYWFLDYRLTAALQFRLLSIFCQVTQQTIDDALQIFLRTDFVGSHVIPQQLFEYQANSLIRDWQLSVINQFLRTIQLHSTTSQGNQLMNFLNAGFFTYVLFPKQVIMAAWTYGDCSCGLSQSCVSSSGIYQIDQSPFNTIELYSIANFFVGCSPLEALFASTLECFYNRTCMIGIDKYLNAPLGESFNFSSLDASINFQNETIKSIINRLMVDSWLTNVSFTSYYNACAPQSCTFEYTRPNDLFLVVTTIIGVFGGLSLGFKILLLITLQLTEKIINGFSCFALMHFIKTLFICRDEHQMTSRLHFVLATVTLCILYTYSAFDSQSITVEIKKPSFSIYQDLATRFPNSLQCPCAQISIKYQAFLTIVPRFHQVCSSEFVSDGWITYLYKVNNLVPSFAPISFLQSASGQFQLLASLCQLSQEIVNDTLLQLATSNFLNIQLLSSSFINERIGKTVSEFKEAIPNLFLNILSLIRETTGANMIVSSWSTNWVVTVPPVINDQWIAHTAPLVYDTCNCGSSWKCIQPSMGMMQGCYALEALFQSTLQCLYDQQCIDQSNVFKAMNTSSLKLSRFDMNTSVEFIVSQLMVEEYSNNMSYENYFAQCAPSSCSYSYNNQSNITEGITNLITLYGGLIIICRLVAVIIVRLFRCRARRVYPESN